MLCPTLPDPANGDVSVQSRTVRGTATYTCSTGYTLSGSSTRTCQTNRAWSGTAPTCNVVQCPVLSPPSGGTVRLTSRTPRGVAIYSCNTGNNLIGSVTRTCLTNEQWSGTEPICQRGICLHCMLFIFYAVLIISSLSFYHPQCKYYVLSYLIPLMVMCLYLQDLLEA